MCVSERDRERETERETERERERERPGVSSELAVMGRESSASNMAFLKAAPT